MIFAQLRPARRPIREKQSQANSDRIIFATNQNFKTDVRIRRKCKQLTRTGVLVEVRLENTHTWKSTHSHRSGLVTKSESRLKIRGKHRRELINSESDLTSIKGERSKKRGLAERYVHARQRRSDWKAFRFPSRGAGQDTYYCTCAPQVRSWVRNEN